MEGVNATSGNRVTNFLYGMVYNETTKPKAESTTGETITTKEYNWTGITILTVGSSLMLFGDCYSRLKSFKQGLAF